jgi:hypothetical protein
MLRPRIQLAESIQPAEWASPSFCRWDEPGNRFFRLDEPNDLAFNQRSAKRAPRVCGTSIAT